MFLVVWSLHVLKLRICHWSTTLAYRTERSFASTPFSPAYIRDGCDVLLWPVTIHQWISCTAARDYQLQQQCCVATGYGCKHQRDCRMDKETARTGSSDYVYASSRQKGASDVRVILRGEMTSISQNDEAISTCRFSATAPDLVSRAVNCSNWCSGLSVKEMADW